MVCIANQIAGYQTGLLIFNGIWSAGTVYNGDPAGGGGVDDNRGWRAAFVVTALILWGGSVSACGCCVYKFCKNKTWGTLAGPGIGSVLLIALVMALLHDGAILFLGVGVPKLGTQPFGAAIAYPVFMSFAIIVGNVNGFLTKEWKGASKQSMQWIAAGIIILIIGVSLLAKGQSMKGKYKPTEAESVEKVLLAE